VRGKDHLPGDLSRSLPTGPDLAGEDPLDGGQRAQKHSASCLGTTLWRWGFPVVFIVAVIWSGVLMLDGLRTVLNSEEGQSREAVTDPSAPGFEAFVEQTWSMLVATEDEDANLMGMAMLAVADRASGGGTALMVPPELEVNNCGFDCNLADLHAKGGIDEGRAFLGSLMGSEFTGAKVLTPTQWVDLPGGAELLALPEQDGPSERLDRQATFWELWLSALAMDSGLAANLGDIDTELARLVETLARGETRVETSPWIPSEDSMTADPAALQQATDAMFPFPIPPESGSGPTVRLLNGTGDFSIDAYARQVVRATGVDIAVVGNFRNFNVIQTRVVYRDPEMEKAAATLAAAIDAGVILDEAVSPAADLTVVLGADFTDRAG